MNHQSDLDNFIESSASGSVELGPASFQMKLSR